MVGKEEYEIAIVSKYKEAKSLMSTYSFKFNTLSVFKRKVLQGVISLEQMKEENAKRDYLYDEWY